MRRTQQPATTRADGQSDGGTGSARAPCILAGLVLIGSVLALVLAAVILRQTWHGDPAIYLSYARNIAAGDVFTFNPGEFSSGSTSPLWAALLALPFALGLGPAGAKALAALALAAAWLSCVVAARRLGAGLLGASVAAAAVLALATTPSLLLFESALTILTVTWGAVFLERVAAGSARAWAGLALCWALLPMVRPDAVLLVPLAALVLLRAGPVAIGPSRVLGALAAASVPALLYFGASWILTGHASAPAACRGFALREGAARLFGIPYALGGVFAFSASPLVLLGLFALAGRPSPRTRGTGSATWRWALLSVATYAFVVTFVSPVAGGTDRYLLPVVPLLGLAAARPLDRVATLRLAGRDVLLPGALVVALAAVPLARVVLDARAESRRGYALDTILEREIAERVNAALPSGGTVLAYEVQARYYLDRGVRLLSLDGITDGRVAPYLASGDMGAFLRAERPALWIANDAVRYRPYLARSILRYASDALGTRTGQSLEIDGVRFTLLAVNERPRIPDFAGWTQLVRLEYL